MYNKKLVSYMRSSQCVIIDLCATKISQILFLKLAYSYNMYEYFGWLYLCAQGVRLLLLETRRDLISLETKDKTNCEQPGRCWKTN